MTKGEGIIAMGETFRSQKLQESQRLGKKDSLFLQGEES